MNKKHDTLCTVYIEVLSLERLPVADMMFKGHPRLLMTVQFDGDILAVH